MPRGLLQGLDREGKGADGGCRVGFLVSKGMECGRRLFPHCAEQRTVLGELWGSREHLGQGLGV